MLNLDTHIVIHSLTGELHADERAFVATQPCGISAMVLWEIAMLAQANRISYDLDHPAILTALSRLTIWPLDREVCRRIGDLDFESDPADEIIAATSLAHDIPLLTRDRVIRRSKVVPLAK